MIIDPSLHPQPGASEKELKIHSQINNGKSFEELSPIVNEASSAEERKDLYWKACRLTL
jgi:hypothetical protein